MTSLGPANQMEKVNALLLGTAYTATQFLGRGSVGDVYAIHHEFLGRDFALKLLHPHLTNHRRLPERMRVEAQAMGSLDHPNAVAVIDFWFAVDGRPCIVMELLQGRTLADEIRERARLPAREAVALTCEVLAALSAAHALGIVHRDMKPQNVFLHNVPGVGRVTKVLDFGIARVVQGVSPRAPAPLTQSTGRGTLIGSPRFISPEALRGERVDHRSDLYSLGLVLYEMLTGEGPFDNDDVEPVPPSQVAPGVAEQLDAVVLRALRDQPDQRYQSANDFLIALQSFTRTAPHPRTQ